jgi:hypothetical protein
LRASAARCPEFISDVDVPQCLSSIHVYPRLVRPNALSFQVASSIPMGPPPPLQSCMRVSLNMFEDATDIEQKKSRLDASPHGLTANQRCVFCLVLAFIVVFSNLGSKIGRGRKLRAFRAWSTRATLRLFLHELLATLRTGVLVGSSSRIACVFFHWELRSKVKVSVETCFQFLGPSSRATGGLCRDLQLIPLGSKA